MAEVLLRSGTVAELAGVNQQTLRYYERRGLLEKPSRSSGGHRLYSEQAVTTLRIIKAAQRLGFTLEEVTGLLEAAKHRHGSAPFREAARSKLADVESRIADLQVIAAILRESIAAECTDLESCAAAKQCPIPFETLTKP